MEWRGTCCQVVFERGGYWKVSIDRNDLRVPEQGEEPLRSHVPRLPF